MLFLITFLLVIFFNTYFIFYKKKRPKPLFIGRGNN